MSRYLSKIKYAIISLMLGIFLDKINNTSHNSLFRSVTTAQDVKMEPPPSPPPPTYVASTSPVKQSSTVTAETMQLRLELHLEGVRTNLGMAKKVTISKKSTIAFALFL